MFPTFTAASLFTALLFFHLLRDSREFQLRPKNRLLETLF